MQPSTRNRSVLNSGGSGGASEARAALSSFRIQRLAITLPLIFLLGSVVYRKRKQILRRTWWRGQHFDLDGQPYAYALQHFWTAFLVPLTLGWAGPWRASKLERRKINEMHIGGQRFCLHLVSQQSSEGLEWNCWIR